MPVAKEEKGLQITPEKPTDEPVKQDAPKAPEETEDQKPQSYVHLADGSVLRVFDEDLPVGGGTGSPHGFWQRGNKVYVVTAVYPVEHVVGEDK